MHSSFIQLLNEKRLAREPVAVMTELDGGEKVLLTAEEAQNHPLSEELGRRFLSGKSGVVETEQGQVFLQLYLPSPRIVVVGAVHISQHLYPMAQSCGYDVSIVDPRTAFATPERFADVALHAEWPEEIWPQLGVDAYTALVALTHDPKIDDYALKAALEARCFYVGALGSRKTHAKRVARLLENGVSEDALSTIHSPIGLDIGSSSPAEIAVAIMGEIIAELRTGSA